VDGRDEGESWPVRVVGRLKGVLVRASSGTRGLAAQKFADRLPSFWGWFLCGLVLGESGSSRRGTCLE